MGCPQIARYSAGAMKFIINKMARGSSVRAMAEKRPSAVSARTLRRILKRSRISFERRERISARLPPVCALNCDCGGEEPKVFVAHPFVEVGQCSVDVATISDLIADETELGARRIRHLPRNQGERNRERMTSPKAAHDHVNHLRQLLSERRDSLSPRSLQESIQQQSRPHGRCWGGEHQGEFEGKAKVDGREKARVHEYERPKSASVAGLLISFPKPLRKPGRPANSFLRAPATS